jgi:Fic family protein
MRIPSNFRSSKIVWNYLSEIEKKCRILKRGNEVSEKEWQRLISENLLRSSLFSAKVEGNSLEMKDISRLSIKNVEHLEVRNIIRALKYINKNVHPSQKITIKFITRLHSITLNKIDENAGKIRKKQNAIFNKEGFVVYMPPTPDEVLPLIKRLVKYINSKKQNNMPLVKAILVHFVFEKIHPFIDGNGRVGRLLIYAILKISDSRLLRAISFEEKLNEEKAGYYDCLDRQDATSFVEFMLKIINDSFDDSVEKIVVSSKKETLDLLPRREEILRIINDHKIISLDFLSRRFQEISERTLRHDLEDLVKRKLIIKLGKTRGVMYKSK